MGVDNPTIASGIAIALLVFIGILGLSGGAQKVAVIERYATALNLSVIGAMLLALAASWVDLIGAGESAQAGDSGGREPARRRSKSQRPPAHSLRSSLTGWDSCGLLIKFACFPRFATGRCDPSSFMKALQLSCQFSDGRQRQAVTCDFVSIHDTGGHYSLAHLSVPSRLLTIALLAPLRRQRFDFRLRGQRFRECLHRSHLACARVREPAQPQCSVVSSRNIGG